MSEPGRNDVMQDPEPKQITAGVTDAGRRLDLWLEGYLPELSRSRIQSLIKSGCITADGHAVKAHTKVHAGMVALVDIPLPEPVELVPEDIPLDVLYEDSDLIVVNKAAGLVVHPAAGHAAGTLVHALLHRCRDLKGIGGELRPGIVHRLDKDTSGAMVAAKSEQAMDDLIRQFKAGTVEKEYLALVNGLPQPESGTIETLIGRSRHNRKKMTARPVTGRRALTDFHIEEVLGDVTLLKVRIRTGRTHQIRVHMSHIGHPVLGDKQYGGRGSAVSAPRQMLHARRLAFDHPDGGRRVECIAPLPNDMELVIEQARQLAK